MPNGVIEIKCPYSLCNAGVADIATLDYISTDGNGVYHMKEDHKYHYQMLGRMGISGLTWGDFVVYAKSFIFVQRVMFDCQEWEATKLHLESFLF